jgi:hypothetical protein
LASLVSQRAKRIIRRIIGQSGSPAFPVYGQKKGQPFRITQSQLREVDLNIVALVSKSSPIMSDPVALPPAVVSKKRCIIYIDAFNWYFGIFLHRPAWKWLNLQSYFESLRPDEEVVAVRFFTAVVEPQHHVSPKRDRQKRYLKAIGTLPKVQVILGKYQERTVTCRAAACPRRLEYRVAKEKKTDVNIAVHLIDDAMHHRADSMIIVSGDSDLEPAVEWVRRNQPAIRISVYIPALEEDRQQRRNDNYQRMQVNCRPLPLGDIARHLLPPSVTLADGTSVARPTDWQ